MSMRDDLSLSLSLYTLNAQVSIQCVMSMRDDLTAAVLVTTSQAGSGRTTPFLLLPPFSPDHALALKKGRKSAALSPSDQLRRRLLLGVRRCMATVSGQVTDSLSVVLPPLRSPKGLGLAVRVLFRHAEMHAQKRGAKHAHPSILLPDTGAYVEELRTIAQESACDLYMTSRLLSDLHAALGGPLSKYSVSRPTDSVRVVKVGYSPGVKQLV
ncbi:hypothetical protein KIPB_012071, partial [Kipferlia bialata]|eukprot:g12071.t1